MTERRGFAEDPYWNDDRELASIRFGRADQLVYVRSHVSPEQYHGIGSETLFPLDSPTGERTYVQSHLYFYAPPTSSRVQRLADAQSWYYPSTRAAVVWELLPAAPLFWQPDPDPREDFTLRSLWLAYERFLAARFPAAEQLLTTWEDTYDRGDWQGFLTTIGYHQSGPAAFSKPLPRSP